MPAIRPWTPPQQLEPPAEDPNQPASAHTATQYNAVDHGLRDTASSLTPKMSSDDDADIEMDDDGRDDDDDTHTIRGESSMTSDESPPTRSYALRASSSSVPRRRKRAGGESDRESAMEVEDELSSSDERSEEKPVSSRKGKGKGAERLADDWYIPDKLSGVSHAVLIGELHKDGDKWWRRREGTDMTLIVPTPTAYKQAPRTSLPAQRPPQQPAAALTPRQPPPQSSWPYYPQPDRMNPYWPGAAAYPPYPYWPPPPHMYPPYGPLPPQRGPEWDYGRDYPGHAPQRPPSPRSGSGYASPAIHGRSDYSPSRAYSPPPRPPASPQHAPPRPPPPRPSSETQSAFPLRPEPQAAPPPSPSPSYPLRSDYPYPASSWPPPYDYGRGAPPGDYWGYEQPHPPAPASTARRASAPVVKAAPPPPDEHDDEDVIVYLVHKDYILPQSSTLLWLYAQICENAPKDLENPLRKYPFRTHPPFPRHMPKSTASHPVIRLHLPDPASFGQVLQYVYCGSQSYKMLDSALRQGHVTFGGLLRNAEWLGLSGELKHWLGDWWQRMIIDAGKRMTDVGGVAVTVAQKKKLDKEGNGRSGSGEASASPASD